MHSPLELLYHTSTIERFLIVRPFPAHGSWSAAAHRDMVGKIEIKMVARILQIFLIFKYYQQGEPLSTTMFSGEYYPGKVSLDFDILMSIILLSISFEVI